MTRVRSQGHMRVSFNVVTRNLARFGYKNHSTHTGSVACTEPHQWCVMKCDTFYIYSGIYLSTCECVTTLIQLAAIIFSRSVVSAAVWNNHISVNIIHVKIYFQFYWLYSCEIWGFHSNVNIVAFWNMISVVSWIFFHPWDHIGARTENFPNHKLVVNILW